MILLIGSLGGGGRARRAEPEARHPQRLAEAAQKPATSSTPSRPAGAPTVTTPVSPALATELEATGHGLVAAGRYATAAPVLRRALAATGESAAECLDPSSDACLTFAYALYDLGRDLQLSGQPAAAVPILERRLQIDNQRPVVQSELSLAQAELK